MVFEWHSKGQGFDFPVIRNYNVTHIRYSLVKYKQRIHKDITEMIQLRVDEL